MQKGFQYKDHKYTDRFFKNGRWHYIYPSVYVNGARRLGDKIGDKAKSLYGDAKFEYQWQKNRARHNINSAYNTIMDRSGLSARDRYRRAESNYKKQSE